MRKIRVLVVDDSTVIRRLLTDALSGDNRMEVAAVAANGKIALAKIPQVNPDVITLDMEMPEMDGITTLVELRKLYPKLPVIMFSTLTQRGAEATMDALAKGANDYVTKPANVGSVTAALQNVRNELVPKIKAHCPWFAKEEKTAFTASAIARPVSAAPSTRKGPKIGRIDIVTIGVSTGGPNALAAIIPKLPANFPVPIVLVQHMPPIFTKHLADRLNTQSALEVREAAPGEFLKAGTVWIAPGDYHMVLERQAASIRIATNQGTPENSCRPAVDVLFRSVSDIYGSNTLAVILTGMGQDGMRGCEAVQQAGGRVLIQDEATSVVWGMPGAVSNAGLADQTLPLDRIAIEIIRVAQQGRSSRPLELIGT